MKQFVRILPVVAAVLLLHSGLDRKGSFDITDASSKQTKQAHIVELQKKGSFDLKMAGGKDPELPSVPA